MNHPFEKIDYDAKISTMMNSFGKNGDKVSGGETDRSKGNKTNSRDSSP